MANQTLAQQIKALGEQRAEKLKSMKALAAIAQERELKPEEETQYNALKAEIEGMNKRMNILNDQAQMAAEESTPVAGYHTGTSSTSEADEKRKMYSKYSLKRALNMGLSRHTKRDGVEAELDAEERNIMIESGVTDLRTDSILVPAQVLRKSEKRDMTATGSSGAEGGYSIQQNVQGVIDVLLPETVLRKLPVLRLNNLRGNVRFPKMTTQPSAGWNTENGSATEKSPAADKLDLSPKRLAAYIQVSNQLLAQSEANINAYAQQFLINASAIEFEKVCLKGGGSNEPTGIIGGSGYNAVYAGGAANNSTNANGAAPVWADIVNLVKSAKAQNANGQAYITSPSVVGKLQITPRQASGTEGNFIVANWNSGANGFPMYATTTMVDTYSKGSATGVLSAIIFGDFSKFVTASWGGMEIGIDPYTNMKEGITNVVLNSYVDCGMLNPEAFSVVKDVDAR